MLRRSALILAFVNLIAAPARAQDGGALSDAGDAGGVDGGCARDGSCPATDGAALDASSTDASTDASADASPSDASTDASGLGAPILCRSDRDCASGENCLAYACEASLCTHCQRTGSSPRCTTDSECGRQSRCFSGGCVTVCVNPQEVYQNGLCVNYQAPLLPASNPPPPPSPSAYVNQLCGGTTTPLWPTTAGYLPSSPQSDDMPDYGEGGCSLPAPAGTSFWQRACCALLALSLLSRRRWRA